MISTERLWLNKDRTKVVKDGDKEAAFLLAIPGREIPEEYAHLVKSQGKPENKDLSAETQDKGVSVKKKKK